MLQMTGLDYWVLSSSGLFLDIWKLWSMLFIWTKIYLVFLAIDGIHYIWIEKWILDIFSSDSKLCENSVPNWKNIYWYKINSIQSR